MSDQDNKLLDAIFEKAILAGPTDDDVLLATFKESDLKLREVGGEIRRLARMRAFTSGQKLDRANSAAYAMNEISGPFMRNLSLLIQRLGEIEKAGPRENERPEDKA